MFVRADEYSTNVWLRFVCETFFFPFLSLPFAFPFCAAYFLATLFQQQTLSHANYIMWSAQTYIHTYVGACLRLGALMNSWLTAATHSLTRMIACLPLRVWQRSPKKKGLASAIAVKNFIQLQKLAQWDRCCNTPALTVLLYFLSARQFRCGTQRVRSQHSACIGCRQTLAAEGGF